MTVAVLMSSVLVMGSCTLDKSSSNRLQLLETGKPALHAIQNNELKEIMKNLNRLHFDRMPQELDHDPFDWHLKKVEQIAGKMSQATVEIATLSENIEINPQEKKLFDALAEKLGQQAGELELAAKDRDILQVRQAMNSMTTTCNACHSAFRMIPERKH